MERRYEGHIIALKTISIFLCLNFSAGSSENLVFRWLFNDNAVLMGHGSSLECSEKDASASRLIIRKLNSTKPLGQNITWLIIHWESTTCDKMGAYVCENDKNDSKMEEVKIYNCPPQPCDEGSKNMLIYAEAGETIQRSFCVISYPDLSTHAKLNGTSIRATKQKEVGSWIWDFEKSNISIIYTVTIRISNISARDYGKRRFSIFTTEDQRHMLEYTVSLRRSDRPTTTSTTVDGKNSGSDFLSTNQVLCVFLFMLLGFVLAAVFTRIYCYLKKRCLPSAKRDFAIIYSSTAPETRSDDENTIDRSDMSQEHQYINLLEVKTNDNSREIGRLMMAQSVPNSQF